MSQHSKFEIKAQASGLHHSLQTHQATVCAAGRCRRSPFPREAGHGALLGAPPHGLMYKCHLNRYWIQAYAAILERSDVFSVQLLIRSTGHNCWLFRVRFIYHPPYIPDSVHHCVLSITRRVSFTGFLTVLSIMTDPHRPARPSPPPS